MLIILNCEFRVHIYVTLIFVIVIFHNIVTYNIVLQLILLTTLQYLFNVILRGISQNVHITKLCVYCQLT